MSIFLADPVYFDHICRTAFKRQPRHNYDQIVLFMKVKTRPEVSSVPEIAQVIEEVEKKLGNRGRVLVRYSGTQNMCRVMVEGPTHEETDRYCRKIAGVVKEKLSCRD